MSDKEDELKIFIYDLNTPIDSVFDKIKTFQDFCSLTENIKSDRQLVQLAYFIFNKTNAFMDSLKKWNSKPLAEKTSINFKLHM